MTVLTPLQKRSLLALAWAALFLTICRLIFYFANHSYFPAHSFGYTIYCFIVGLRFDIATIVYFHFPFCLYILLSPFFANARRYAKFFGRLFLFTQGLLMLVSLIDTAYFPFIFRRSTIETMALLRDLHFRPGGLLRDYWYLFIAFPLLCWLFYRGYKRIATGTPDITPTYTRKPSPAWSLLWIVIIIVAVRGLHRFALTPSSAGLYVKSSFSPLVNNTPFNLLFSYYRYHRGIAEMRWEELPVADSTSVFSIRHSPNVSQPFRKSNVYIILLESFSRSYLQAGHPYKAETPFLDSIMAQSLVCENAFANGTISIQAINSVLGSVPPIAYQTITASPFEFNRLEGFGHLLSNQGYATNFFFGSTPDHFGFERLVKAFGVQRYFGQKEFDNDKFYDGTWGIYDAPFFDWAAHQLLNEQQPRFALLFNLSSHYPYSIPEPFASSLPKGPLNSSQSVRYVDQSLRSFFEILKTDSAYNQSLFVFVGDHWSHEDNSQPAFGLHRYPIPLFFFTPDRSIQAGKITHIADQLDILPTVMDWLHYPSPYISFGQSILDSSAHHYTYSLLEYPNIVQIADDSLTLQFDVQKKEAIALYNYKTDSAFSRNLLGEVSSNESSRRLESQLRVFLSLYFKSLAENKLYWK